MKHELININSYLFVVDDSEIKEGDYCLMFDDFGNLFLGGVPSKYLGLEAGHHLNKGLRKTIAHLPLNNSPILEGVPLLPPLPSGEDDVEKLAENYKNQKGSIPTSELEDEIFKLGFKDGYNKAKEKFKWTDEDVVRIVEKSRETGLTAEYLILSMSQPKMPVAFECEMVIPYRLGKYVTWVGKYIY